MFKEKSCRTCGDTFAPEAPAQLYCTKEECHPIKYDREYYNKAQKKHRLKLGYEVGIGSGNHSKNKGETSPRYTCGITYFRKFGRHLKELFGLCQRCQKDIKDVGPHEWVAHHIDYDRTNNDVFTNLELLCKRCHQIEHDCIKAFESSTTNCTPKQEEAVGVCRHGFKHCVACRR